MGRAMDPASVLIGTELVGACPASLREALTMGSYLIEDPLRDQWYEKDAITYKWLLRAIVNVTPYKIPTGFILQDALYHFNDSFGGSFPTLAKPNPRTITAQGIRNLCSVSRKLWRGNPNSLHQEARTCSGFCYFVKKTNTINCNFYKCN